MGTRAAVLPWLGIALGCASSNKGARPVDFRANDVRFTRQDLFQVDAELTGVLDNPTTKEIRVLDARYEVLFDDRVAQPMKTVALDRVAPRGGTLPIELATSIVYAADAEELEALQSNTSGQVLVRGSVRVVESGRGDSEARELAFSRAREMRTPRMPRVFMREIGVGMYGGGDMAVTFYVAIQNPNPFELALKKCPYELFIEGKRVSSGPLSPPDKIPPSIEAAVYELSQELTREEWGKDLPYKARMGGISYKLTGEASFGALTVPFTLEGTLPASSS